MILMDLISIKDSVMEQSNNISSPIILNLNASTDVTEFKYDEIFQVEARDSILKKINEQLSGKETKNLDDSIKELENNSSLFYDRLHNAITICGPRGSGKSTFIRHILTCIDKPIQFKQAKIPNDLTVIKVIDPTSVSYTHLTLPTTPYV